MKLILAVDLHDDTEPLVEAGVQWAVRTGGRLSLLFVEELGEAWSVGVSDPTVISLLETEREAIRVRHRTRLDELMQLIPEPHRGEAIVASGVAWNAISDASKDFDLLLVGTHGRKGLAHFFLGSVAERVVRAAHCSVLVLRGKEA